MILQGVNPETHDDVITMVSLRFIKSGILPTKIVKDFKLLLSRRTDVDYGDFESIDEYDAEDSLKLSESLINQVDTLRKKLIDELCSD